MLLAAGRRLTRAWSHRWSSASGRYCEVTPSCRLHLICDLGHAFFDVPEFPAPPASPALMFGVRSCPSVVNTLRTRLNSPILCGPRSRLRSNTPAFGRPVEFAACNLLIWRAMTPAVIAVTLPPPRRPPRQRGRGSPPKGWLSIKLKQPKFKGVEKMGSSFNVSRGPGAAPQPAGLGNPLPYR